MPSAVIVLAAGEGTRMRSRALPKVLHAFAGRSMLGHVLAAAAPLASDRTAVVVGHRRDEVVAHLAAIAPDALPVVQAEQHGTGHAVRLALEAIGDVDGTVLVVPGDAPLLTAEALTALVEAHTGAGSAATLLTSVVDDPTGYGRVVRDAAGSVLRVVEQKDATPDELAVREVATSVFAFDGRRLRETVASLSSDNAAGEEYLTDVVGLLVAAGAAVGAVAAPAEQTAGVNDRVQLAAARRAYNDRLLEAHMRAGVTVVDPASAWVDADVVLAPDVVLHPSVELHGRTEVGEGAEIGPQTTLTDTVVGAAARVHRTVAIGARIGSGVTLGPFAYLRPGTELGDDVHVGTYVEIKNSTVGTATKIPHLSYVGDADIGEHTNIGAATVFVNYDGVAKHRSSIGDHARTGADNMFVAPVEVGDGAYTAAGSVITQDVPPGAMGVARGRQRNVAGWVLRKRAGTPAADAAEQALAQQTDDDE
ncbi:bifunctional UDP-N-acetylglucosamine diphosphorylase/glucosamine-1-phosphate N-acetyltransferase GlmU [Jatrophihabitans endophyticus]|uniref:bifunctional UDP-N-acetylglucosamine diphosphorylase/glucosamine-1-phosphate N-acetyltransferase GlmU n=1 Tax=Jatrophihabitans endophyticus TaxID=1206085 RepID=UPI001A091FED|nr:bifunctional UDP-N-acetylglucosamine diphosphorylase/glucosamine-1-phosphate N-acetyltransferase GlmU [Jatrophihabitans endophyticus]